MTKQEHAAVVRMASNQSKAHVRALTRTLRELKTPEKEVQENVRLFWRNEAKSKCISY